ncbi:DinB family protein [Lentzea tibetensis]|uniref:DinB family protein n=1 Tax=Lentzea tibetensis TaxID=2591470 RepID=A0A563EGG6_9PSEU|nr:DinB family protein [Lentzea tibetensis]TWP43646.1 DinB family protein [Lentzea tibetensis]
MTSTQTLPENVTGERADLLETLIKHRGFLMFAARGLTDEQAASTPTVSVLSIGGLIKHVTVTEHGWASFILQGAPALEMGPDTWAEHENNFKMLPGDTIEGLLAEYQKVAARTDELVRTVDLDLSHALPEAPWFEQGKKWSARRVLVHIVAETSQHAGHADIIRETIDGQKTMG